jgi:hypothetical protein
MPLAQQVYDLPLVTGLNERQRDESRDPASGFRLAENVVQRKLGAWSKRRGYVALDSPTYTGSGLSSVHLTTHRDAALLAHDGSQLDVYSPTAGWNIRGRVPCVETERTSIASTGIFRGTSVYECVYAGGYLVVVYETARALYAVVLDATTKEPVRGPEQLAAGLSGADALQEFRMQLAVVGSNVLAIYNRENVVALTREDIVRARILDVTDVSAGWGAAVTILAAGNISLTVGDPLFEVCSLSTRWAMVYRHVSGELRLGTWNGAGAVVTAAVNPYPLSPSVFTFCVEGDESDTLWVGRIQTNLTQVDVVAFNPTTLATTGTVLNAAYPDQLTGADTSEAGAICAIVRTGTGTAKVVTSGIIRIFGDYDRSFVGWRDLAISAGAVTSTSTASRVLHLELFSRPWRMASGRVLVGVVPRNTLDNVSGSAPPEEQLATNRERCLYVGDITDVSSGLLPPVATLAPRIVAAQGMLFFPPFARVPVRWPDGHAGLMFPVLRSGISETFEVAELRQTSRGSAAEVGGAVYGHGGIAWLYDGSKSFEASYLQIPRVKAGNHPATGITGTYLYTAVWEHEDAAGNVHYSTPAAPISVTLANQKGRIRVSTCSVTQREERAGGTDRIRCVLYRTAAGGSTYYRCAEGPNYDTTTNGAFVEFLDQLLDATLTQRARLYTQPGTPGTSLPRRSPPGFKHVVAHGDVVAGIADDGRTIWFSAPRVPGEGAWWNDAFVAEVEDTTPLTALASFDGRLWAFTRSSVFVIDGQGFGENGTGGYSLPARIPVDVGCIESRSVVVTPEGAFFQSHLGLCMLTRSQQVVWPGETVTDTLAAYPTVTSATLHALETQVVFTCTNGTTGAVIVYDYNAKAWTTERRADNAAMASATVLGSELYLLRATDQLLRRSAATYLDATAFSAQAWETGWLKLAGLQGFQRIWRVLLLFTQRTACGLRVTLTYDYRDDAPEVREFAGAALVAGKLEISPRRQRCQALRVRVEELAPDPAELGTGQGLEFTGLRVVVGMKTKALFAKAQKG